MRRSGYRPSHGRDRRTRKPINPDSKAPYTLAVIGDTPSGPVKLAESSQLIRSIGTRRLTSSAVAIDLIVWAGGVCKDAVVFRGEPP
jgi:hypothetical protein